MCLGWAVVLLMGSCLGPALGAGHGCSRWRASGGEEVCCQACSLGYRIFRRCGPDIRTLCVPCEADTYSTDGTQQLCYRCTQCIGVQREREACTARRDTLCECIEGFRCGNTQCSHCIKECRKGEQPTVDRSCQACPDGTFNTQIHQKCAPWRRSCPEPGQTIMKSGTALSDIICSTNATVPLTPGVRPTGVKQPHSEWTVLIVILVVANGATILVACVVVTYKRKQATKTAPAGLWQEVQEVQEECNFRLPQQEHGASSSSTIAPLVAQESLLSV